MSQQNSIESPLIFASPEAMSNCESGLSPNPQALTNDFPMASTEDLSSITDQDSTGYVGRITAIVADFYKALAKLDTSAQANTAQGNASKVKSYTIVQPPNSSTSDKIICTVIHTQDAAARERRILKESTFKLQPAPLWTTRSNKYPTRITQFKPIEVGSDYRHPNGAEIQSLSAPQPTAKVSTWLNAIPGSSSVFANLFEADEPLDLLPVGSPRLSDLDSFNPVFEMKGWEAKNLLDLPAKGSPCLSHLESFNPVFEMKGWEADQSFEVLDSPVRKFWVDMEAALALVALSRRGETL